MPKQTIFPPAVISEVHIRAQGIPRVINGICDNLLLTMFAMESREATVEMVDEVTTDMRLDWPTKRKMRSQPTGMEQPSFGRGD